MNALDFGDLTVATNLIAASSDDTRGLFGGGRSLSSNQLDTIDYVTIATTMNAIDFGNLTVARRDLASCAPAGSPA